MIARFGTAKGDRHASSRFSPCAVVAVATALFAVVAPASAPPRSRAARTRRVWRISPYAYTEFVAGIAGKPDPKKPVPQPFAGLTENGLKDYAVAFTVDEPTTQ